MMKRMDKVDVVTFERKRQIAMGMDASIALNLTGNS